MDSETEEYIASLLAAKEQSLKEANGVTAGQIESHHERSDNIENNDRLDVSRQSSLPGRAPVECDGTVSLAATHHAPCHPSDPTEAAETIQDATRRNFPHPEDEVLNSTVILNESGGDGVTAERTFHFERCPSLKRLARSEFAQSTNVRNNFLKGCKWSPDGSCLLTGKLNSIAATFNFEMFSLVNSF